jgi:hypothetical protein
MSIKCRCMFVFIGFYVISNTDKIQDYCIIIFEGSECIESETPRSLVNGPRLHF